ncbi:uncharacterized protein LOC115440567 [Manduca sexta]|uniref:uncharacterized protein LOC115440567 n=1 Tax=Manduca sexta TaxID=7130 RepID=UPI00188F5B8B|nr:uncharacterized protein LOC115440567 [Manduca sexta]
MPCRCTGVKLNKCKCVLDTVYPLRSEGSNLVLVRNDSDCLQHRLARRGILYRLLECMYGKCAEYNLRYCPLRGFIRPGSQLGNTLKDLLVLACFIVANFVVFLTIVSKIIIHVYFGVKHTACWLRRCIDPKMAEDRTLLSGRHDYSPPNARIFH